VRPTVVALAAADAVCVHVFVCQSAESLVPEQRAQVRGALLRNPGIVVPSLVGPRAAAGTLRFP
jgi:hypothetical protein